MIQQEVTQARITELLHKKLTLKFDLIDGMYYCDVSIDMNHLKSFDSLTFDDLIYKIWKSL